MRILIVQSGSLKHLLFSLPVWSDLRRQFPTLTIDCCVETSLSGIASAHPATGRVLPVPFQRWRQHLASPQIWREIRSFRQRLRAVDYDAILDVQGSHLSAMLSWQACGPACGFDALSARHPWAARFYDLSFTIPRIVHAVERKRWLAAAAFELPLETPLEYGLSVPPLVADWLPQSPYVVFCPATEKHATHPLHSLWPKLTQTLHSEGYTVVFCSQFPDSLPAIPQALTAPPLSTPEIAAALLSGAKGIIGHVNELTHLAAALGRPVICLHPGNNPELNGILGSAPFRNLACSGTIPEVSTLINLFQTCLRSCHASSTPCCSRSPCH